MSSHFVCPNCGNGLATANVMGQERFRCTKCGTMLATNQLSVVIGVVGGVGLMFSLAHMVLAGAGALGWSEMAFWTLAICLYLLAGVVAYGIAVRIIRVDRLGGCENALDEKSSS